MRKHVAVPDEAGKIARHAFEGIIKPRLGAPRPEVLVGPRHGVDVGVVDLGGGQVMALTTDPFFVVPEFGWDRAAWFAVHIVASDAATSGLRPAYLTVDLNLPHAMTDTDLDALWQGVDAACRDLGVAVVTGHTGRYDGCAYPMLGGATVICTGSRDAYVTPAMAQAGDAVVVTKGAAIETCAVLGVTFPQRIAAELGRATARAAADLFFQMTVVPDALCATEVGVRERGVSAMHDATERGVWNALCEVAEASGTGIVVDREAIPVRPEVRAICDLFGVDPYSASSEGTLIITCRPHRVEALLERLEGAGICAARVGEIVPAERGMRAVCGGVEGPMEPPRTDPFWPAFIRALDEGMR